MAERNGYIPGVPCWIDTSQPDPQSAADFYGGLFGWETEDAMPPGADGKYMMARIRNRDVAAISSVPAGAPAMATWNTYVRVESADATASKVADAGGTVLTAPFDVMDAGRMAVFADPEGAVFMVWQPRAHQGAGLVNEHGTVNFNDLHTRDVEGAKRFYGAVFGWETLTLDGGFSAWTLPGYGDHLAIDNPGIREQMESVGAPAAFADVVASLVPLGDDRPDVAPHWGVTFAVDDADAIAARAVELGGSVVVPVMDAPWVRMTVIADPAGATFTASKFVAENAELATQAGTGSAA